MANLDTFAVPTVNRMRVLREWLDPEHTGLVIVDMQEEFTHRESNVSRWIAVQNGIDVSSLPPYNPAGPMYPGDPDLDEIPALRNLIGRCRSLNIPVVWVPSRLTEATDSRFWKTTCLRSTYEGEWVERISAGLEPLPGEPVILKTRPSGFFRTDLEKVLNAAAITTVLMTGRATSGCVEATCRDAMARDYGVVLVADCCGPPGPNHDADVRKIGMSIGFPAFSEEVINILAVRVSQTTPSPS